MARLRTSILALVSVFFAADIGFARAATVTVGIQREADTIVIEASATLDADATTAWNVLTDYERYAEFIPGVRSSRVIARRGPAVTVDQYDDAVLWLLRVPVHVTYEITEVPPSRIVSRAVARPLPALDSTYALASMPSGVRLEYTGRLEPGSLISSQVAEWALQRSVVRQFQALADEIERRTTAESRTSRGATN